MERFPSLAPIDINKDMWFYEQDNGIDLIVRLYDSTTGSYRETINILVPWKKLFTSSMRWKRHFNRKKKRR